jgi:hypothetical protein
MDPPDRQRDAVFSDHNYAIGGQTLTS